MLIWIKYIYIYIISCLFIIYIKSYELPMNLGSEIGLSSSSIIQPEALTRIMEGMARNNKESLYSFGLLCLYGIARPKSEVEAVKSLLKAATLGHIEAMTAYSVLTISGIGTKKDDHIAMQWLRKAVELGDINAHWLLGK
jgi:TPR repeat protein